MKKYFKFKIFEKFFGVEIEFVKNLKDFEGFEESVKFEESVRVKFDKDLENFEGFEKVFEEKISRIKENITTFSSSLLLSSI